MVGLVCLILGQILEGYYGGGGLTRCFLVFICMSVWGRNSVSSVTCSELALSILLGTWTWWSLSLLLLKLPTSFSVGSLSRFAYHTFAVQKKWSVLYRFESSRLLYSVVRSCATDLLLSSATSSICRNWTPSLPFCLSDLLFWSSFWCLLALMLLALSWLHESFFWALLSAMDVTSYNRAAMSLA